jgi:hypothetical protein
MAVERLVGRYGAKAAMWIAVCRNVLVDIAATSYQLLKQLRDFAEAKMLVSLATFLLLLQAAPAAADGATAAAEKKICKREKQIGSMVRSKKICRTKSEWAEAESQARQDVGEMQRTSRAPPNG